MKCSLPLMLALLLSWISAGCSVQPDRQTHGQSNYELDPTSVQNSQPEPDKLIPYKNVDDISLALHVFEPRNSRSNKNRPAIVFFHGGGWNGGHPSHFYRQAKHLANRGMVAISAEYRTFKGHGTSPIASLKDAKSAMRYIRAHAKDLGIDPNRIAAGGGSAGGHIATGTATNTDFEEASDDQAISFRPNLLVLFNPVFDNSTNGYGFQRVKEYWQRFSPLHNIDLNTPPGIGFFGEKDTAIKAQAAVEFKNTLADLGTEFVVKIYEDQPHGFFNKAKFKDTLVEMDNYLAAQGYLPPLPSRTYYVDAKNGDDSFSGQDESSPWKTVNKVNQTIFQPGDQILFKRGTQYNGVIELKGSGSANRPNLMSSYGQGAKPIIHGWGKKLHTLLLQNVSHWKVSELAFTNQGKRRQARRKGVFVRGINAGELTNIELSELEVYNVNGSLKKKEGGGVAIFAKNEGELYKTRFNGLNINNNHIHHSGRNGIVTAGYAKRSQWYPTLKVQIKDNLIEQIPGDGIIVIASDGALVQGNILRDFPDILPQGDAAAGIWPWSSDNTLIQFNEVSGHKAKWDGQGFDSDFNSSGTVIQYNYSHDNYGGFLLVCNNGNKLGQDINKGTINTIIRGNISINDGIRPYPTFNGVFSPTFHITGPTQNTQIYDNIIIVPAKPENVDNTLIDMDNWGGSYPVDTVFSNNQIYFQGKLNIKHKNVDSFSFENNLLSNPIKGAIKTKNRIQPDQAFDLEALKRMALKKLEEHKKNEI